MTIRWYAGLAASAAVLVAGLAATPASAAPEPSAADSAKLAAGTLKDPETGKNRTYPAGQGEDVPVVLGVTNVGEAPVDGLVLQVRVLNDLDLTTKYENCWYAVDSNQETAWCEFAADLAPGASLAVTGAGISTSADARAENISSVVYWWMSKQHADAQGGIQALADQWAGQGTKAVRGTADALPMAAPAGELGGIGGPLGFAGVRLVTPPTGEPTATPTPSATPSATPSVAPTAAPSASAGAGGEGGGLPVTGAGTATVAGVGGALLLLGGAGFLIARRRRTRFVA
ncbi:LPXTG-motif cell wall anchor domain-containing protein [Micromonospora echinospora]|uniref:LPXTG-motif cell wall anchor domain-containing protein n=1 Tax=Micromonospora echinospora TaxID=1877 RepID=A0A1C4XFE4_MICEC|nr:LPXTG cell wall anchor domain-containing protein [Micromonospora echinospora]SCF07052.1 LPXTG-motif cell wall anchor domain-containing protein [Micromonospora echinospora]